MKKKPVYSVQQYAKLVGKSPKTVLRWIKEGKVMAKTMRGKKGYEYWIYPVGISEEENTGTHTKAQKQTEESPTHKTTANSEEIEEASIIPNLSADTLVDLIRSKGELDALRRETTSYARLS